MSDELDRPSEEVASPSGQGEVPAPVGSDSLGCGPEHGLRAGSGGRGVSPEYVGPDRATRNLDTQKRGIVDFMSVEEIKKGIESLSEAELGEVAAFLSDLRREVSGRMAPGELGKLAQRLAGNKSRAESERLTSQIVEGFYSGS